ncbi:MAG: hypothetical protein IJW51_05055 [Clostridia bacterium]|nr:hypothetical protein [Clostridia bacterium]
MINSRKKRIGVVIVAVTLSVVLLAGAGFGIAYYCNYYEKAIPMEKFLDYPDGITVYYRDDGKVNEKKLSRDEIDLVYKALEELLPQYNDVYSPQLGRIRKPTTTHPFTTENALGGIEFHYKQRRLVRFFCSSPGLDTTAHYDSSKTAGFSGECDSVLLGNMDETHLHIRGCKNGQYISGDGSIYFPDEAAARFWSVVRSCIE